MLRILDILFPYVTVAFAIWCVVGIAQTAREIWAELRPAPAAPPQSELVPLRPNAAPPLRNAA